MYINKSSNRNQVLSYANSVHKAINGELIPSTSMSGCSDHPYDGYSITVIKDMVDGDIVKSQVRAFEKALKEEMNKMYANLEINTPVKVTKGSKDKRGIEGFILHAKEPLQGSGKALYVYDVLTNRNCMVRSTATKVRIPKPGERDLLKQTYLDSHTLAPHFTKGKKVVLKEAPTLEGVLLSDAELSSNFDNNGFHQVSVQWNTGEVQQCNIPEIRLV